MRPVSNRQSLNGIRNDTFVARLAVENSILIFFQSTFLAGFKAAAHASVIVLPAVGL